MQLPDLHRAPAGRLLRRPAGRRQGHRVARLRRLLPVRPLPQDGRRQRPAGPHRRMDHAGRPGPRHVHRPARDPGHVGHVPAARDRSPSASPQVDQMSGGRVELGLGAGWYEAEHKAYAIAFPPLGERFERLEEQLAIITGLWETPEGEQFGFAGRHYTVEALPGAAEARTAAGRRSSSAAAAPSARPAWPPPTPPSSTCPSRRSTGSPPRRSACARPARSSGATRPR